jgi:hypothetical protein
MAILFEYLYKGILFTHKNEWNTDTSDNVDENSRLSEK